MRFYTDRPQHYRGIDLHTCTLYLCILDAKGNVLLHKDLPCDRTRFLEAIAPYRDELVVASECIFVQNPFHQYNLPHPPGRLVYKYQRAPFRKPSTTPFSRRAGRPISLSATPPLSSSVTSKRSSSGRPGPTNPTASSG